MKSVKKILPAAIVLCFAGAAQAQVSLYGLIDMSYGKNEFIGDTKADFHSGGDDFSSQGNSTTRFGIKGSTDVGNGIKANFKLESAGITGDGNVGTPSTTTTSTTFIDNGGNTVTVRDTDTSNQPFFNRQAWLGFSGGFGEVRLGRQDSIPFQVMGQFDFNGQSNGVTSAYSGVGVWNTGRQSRSLQYLSPQMGGFMAQVGVVPKGNREESVYSGALSYAAGAFAAGASFESKRTTLGDDFGSVAASYDFTAVKVMAGYTDAGVSAKGPTLGIVAPVAGFSVGAHYAKNSEGSKDAVLELFVNKEVFKNTYGYIEAGRMSSDDVTKDKDTSAALGVIYVF